MRRILVFLVLIQFLLSACTTSRQPMSTKLPRYDGVYSAQTFVDGEKYCEYLRFYPNATVITVTSECGKTALQDIKKWFSRENAGPEAAGVSRGTVSIVGNKISFDAVSKEGSVSYEGEILSKRISVSTYSHINEARDHDVYQFITW
jgi:hypothetical protein